jgi:bifunctional DNase/RNase
MTHDLMKSLLDAVEAKVISVVVTDLKDNTYYAKIHLMYEDSEYSIDSRPSDAIALALRTSTPIFASEDVIRKQASEELDQWLENLRPEDFGKYES